MFRKFNARNWSKGDHIMEFNSSSRERRGFGGRGRDYAREAFRRHHESHHDSHDTHHQHRDMRGGFRPPFPPGFGPGFGPGGFGPGDRGFGRGGFGPGDRGFGRGRGGAGGRGRNRRGNVRAAILALLNERSMHGYEMIQELDQRTGGVWRPSPGSVYPTLQLLEDEGAITSESNGGRKSYSLTDAGREEATAAAANAPWAEFSEETVSSGHDTREAVAGIMMAIRQIGFERNPEQWQRAVEVLNETKRKLYAILAEAD
jgi:DNA-binding PadR family transcriptional regulator